MAPFVFWTAFYAYCIRRRITDNATAQEVKIACLEAQVNEYDRYSDNWADAHDEILKKHLALLEDLAAVKKLKEELK